MNKIANDVLRYVPSLSSSSTSMITDRARVDHPEWTQAQVLAALWHLSSVRGGQLIKQAGWRGNKLFWKREK